MKKQLSLLILYWLRFWARIKLNRINPVIIGVTGSAGKSTCVAAIEAIIKSKYIAKTTAGANSESGIPLSILDLKMIDYSLPDWVRVCLLAPIRCTLYAVPYDVLVCEMGIDSLTPPKNMGYLLSIIQPKIGVFLNVLPVHTQQMESTTKIATEKGKLIRSLPKDGAAILNADDPLVISFAKKTKAKVLTFGKFNSTSISVSNLNLDLNPNYFLTADYGYTLAAAIAVGKALGFNQTTSIQQLVSSLQLPPGRGSIFSGINNSLLLDSSYNASPTTVLSALQLLKKELFLKRTLLFGIENVAQLLSWVTCAS